MVDVKANQMREKKKYRKIKRKDKHKERKAERKNERKEPRVINNWNVEIYKENVIKCDAPHILHLFA